MDGERPREPVALLLLLLGPQGLGPVARSRRAGCLHCLTSCRSTVATELPLRVNLAVEARDAADIFFDGPYCSYPSGGPHKPRSWPLAATRPKHSTPSYCCDLRRGNCRTSARGAVRMLDRGHTNPAPTWCRAGRSPKWHAQHLLPKWMSCAIETQRWTNWCYKDFPIKFEVTRNHTQYNTSR